MLRAFCSIGQLRAEDGEALRDVFRKAVVILGFFATAPVAMGAVGYYAAASAMQPEAPVALAAAMALCLVACALWQAAYWHCRCARAAPAGVLDAWLLGALLFVGGMAVAVPAFPAQVGACGVAVATALCLTPLAPLHLFGATAVFFVSVYNDAVLAPAHAGGAQQPVTATLPLPHMAGAVEAALLGVVGYAVAAAVAITVAVLAARYAELDDAQRRQRAFTERLVKAVRTYNTAALAELIADERADGASGAHLLKGAVAIAQNLDLFRGHIPAYLMPHQEASGDDEEEEAMSSSGLIVWANGDPGNDSFNIGTPLTPMGGFAAHSYSEMWTGMRRRSSGPLMSGAQSVGTPRTPPSGTPSGTPRTKDSSGYSSYRSSFDGPRGSKGELAVSNARTSKSPPPLRSPQNGGLRAADGWGTPLGNGNMQPTPKLPPGASHTTPPSGLQQGFAVVTQPPQWAPSFDGDVVMALIDVRVRPSEVFPDVRTDSLTRVAAAIRAAFNGFMERLHEVAGRYRAVIHNVSGDVIEVTWNAVARCAQPETKAANFAAELKQVMAGSDAVQTSVAAFAGAAKTLVQGHRPHYSVQLYAPWFPALAALLGFARLTGATVLNDTLAARSVYAVASRAVDALRVPDWAAAPAQSCFDAAEQGDGEDDGDGGGGAALRDVVAHELVHARTEALEHSPQGAKSSEWMYVLQKMELENEANDVVGKAVQCCVARDYVEAVALLQGIEAPEVRHADMVERLLLRAMRKLEDADDPETRSRRRAPAFGMPARDL
jgi:hypothetical protein